MPSYTRGRNRDVLTYVNVSSEASLPVFYGFNTINLTAVPNVSQTDLTALGHLEASGVPESGLIIVRANSPKPARVRKIINRRPSVAQQGSVNTFCDPNKLNDAYAQEWQLAKPATVAKVTENARTITGLAVLSNSLVYAFPMNAADWALYASELGLQQPSTVNTERELSLIFSGCRTPRPGQAAKALENGSTITKPFSTGVNVRNAGWEILSRELII